MGMIQRKKAILLNEPHIETVTGNGVSFIADRAADIEECIIDLTAKQEGSGTPSPSNIRRIIDYKNFTVYHSGDDQTNPDEYNYSWVAGRTLGTLNFTTGYLISLGYSKSYTGESGWQAVGNKFYCALSDSGFRDSTSTESQLCNMYPFSGYANGGSSQVTQDKSFYLQRSTNLTYCRVWVYDSGYTLEQFKTLLNTTPLVITYPVSVVFTVTGHQFKALRGLNNVWDSNNGEITVKYWTH